MIQDFLSSFTEELAKPSRFDVNLNVPLDLAYAVGMDSKTLSLRCENATLPGRTLATSELRIYGPTEKFPYQSTYDDITLTFICTSSMLEKSLFNQWMDKINPTESWNFDYKSNYVTDMSITQYDMSDSEVHTVELIDAFPISVNQMDLDWSNDTTYHKISVTFAYTYWHILSAATRNHSIGISRNTIKPYNLNIPNARNERAPQLSLKAALELGSLAYSVNKSLGKGNPYAIYGAIGAATSIIPSLGGTKTLSSLINSQGRAALDTKLDQDASIVNKTNNTINSIKNKTNPFSF